MNKHLKWLEPELKNNKMKEITVADIERIIAEERELHELRLRVNHFAIAERERLLAEGFPGIPTDLSIGDFISSFGTEFIKGYKNQFARWLIANIGVDPNSFIAQVIGNIVEETPTRTIWGWVRGEGDGCNEFGEKLAIGIIETLEERFLNPLMASAGFRNVSTGSIGATFREQIQTLINSTEFMQSVIEVMSNTVCEFEMGSILGVGGGWNRADKGDSPESGPASPRPDAGERMMKGINRAADIQKNITGGGRGPGLAARSTRQVADLVRGAVGEN